MLVRLQQAHPLVLIAMLFVAWKVLIYAFALLSSNMLPLKTDSIAINLAVGTPYLKWIWANFDGIHYITIAYSAYQYPNFAFFPLLPVLISLVNRVFAISRIDAALWVVNVSLLGSLFLLYKTTLLDFNRNVSIRALILLLVFPTSFFYGAIYTDSLYLFLSLASFYAGRKSRWVLAGLIGYFAGMARLVGILLLPALLLEWYLQNRGGKLQLKILIRNFFHQRAFMLLLIPLGLITYGCYLYMTHGDFFLFQKAMAQWSQSQIVFPLQVLYRYGNILLSTPFNFVYFVAVVELLSTIFYFSLSWYVAKKVRISYGVFMFLTLLLPTFTGTFQSMPRYILHLFPAFIALALLTMRSQKVFWVTIIIFLALQFVFVAFFTRGYFIA